MSALAEAFEQHRLLLWGMSYRMLGVPADADEVVQDTFLRAIERPPQLDRALRPWLVRVAMNLSRDCLRARKSRAYIGPWLPAPLEEAPAVTQTPESRFASAESLTLAFLLALEALRPTARAVLLLRDVYGMTGAETAAALSLSPGNVRTTLHRARRVMAEHPPPVLTVQSRQRVRLALEALMSALVRGDLAGVVAAMREDAVLLSDGGGEFYAARVPVVGAEKIARFYLNLIARVGSTFRSEFRMLSGLPTLVITREAPAPGHPPVGVISIEVDEQGRIVRIFSILASGKVAGVRREPPASQQ